MDKKKNISINSNQIISEAIKRISLRGVVNGKTGAVYGTGMVVGYVAKIHQDGALAGTIDVKEYAVGSNLVSGDEMVGYHEGVLLSAIQDNRNGTVIIPKLYSEVVLSTDSDTNTEYVSMFSQVDVVNIDGFQQVSVGVREREEFDVNGDKDICELEETGVYARTTYTKDAISSDVRSNDGESDSHSIVIVGGGRVERNIGDGKTVSVEDVDGVHIEHGESTIEAIDDLVSVSQGSSTIKVTDGTVFVGSDSNTDDAVLGGALCDVLSDLCDYLSQVKVTTQCGPQPFINMSQFIMLKSKIKAAKSAHNNFLTQKVKIQK